MYLTICLVATIVMLVAGEFRADALELAGLTTLVGGLLVCLLAPLAQKPS